MADASSDALRLLAGRELSAAECRTRLLDRGHSPSDVDAVIARLLEDGTLDDARTARAYARTAAVVKGRGRIRVTKELHQKGIARDVAAAAVAEVFGDLDESALVAKAIQRNLRGRPRPSPDDRAAWARLYQYLMRQGFSPAVVTSALERLRGGRALDE